MELQGQVERLRKQGLGLAAISYDSPEILADFAKRRSITFPLLSDPGSETIKHYGLLNTTLQPSDRTYGIPFPGTLMLDARGHVVSRAFEESYRDRNTASSLLIKGGARGGANETKVSTDHFDLVAYSSDAVVAPGTIFSLVLDIAPKPGLHIYAPGVTGYKPIALAIEPQPVFRLRPMSFPPTEEYYFKPLKERVQVYQRPFRLIQDVLLDTSAEAQAALKGLESVTVKGALDYQACTDDFCFNPTSVPLSWTVKVRPLDRERKGS